MIRLPLRLQPTREASEEGRAAPPRELRLGFLGDYFCHTRTQSTSVRSSSGVVESGSRVQPPDHMSSNRNIGWLSVENVGADMISLSSRYQETVVAVQRA